jgi:NMD protein affecting ribosome stability and mRNA decay
MTYQAIYKRCGAPDVVADGLCDQCLELTSSVFDRADSIVCAHCGKSFSEKKFDAHRWSVYYRTNHSFTPSGHPRR